VFKNIVLINTPFVYWLLKLNLWTVFWNLKN